MRWVRSKLLPPKRDTCTMNFKRAALSATTLSLLSAAAFAGPAAAADHTVVPGDTISSIASAAGQSTASILAANGLSAGSLIHPGDIIRTDSAAAAAPAANSSAKTSHTVESGDTMSAIAAMYGVGLAELLDANGMDAFTVIHPGWTIKIAGSAPAAAQAAPAQAAESFQAPTGDIPSIVARTASSMGVDPALALAFAEQESGFNPAAVSSAGAMGTMQVMPANAGWASDLAGRPLDLAATGDNIVAGVAIIRHLVSATGNLDTAIASYYQGQYGVQAHGMYPDTVRYVEQVKARMLNFS